MITPPSVRNFVKVEASGGDEGDRARSLTADRLRGVCRSGRRPRADVAVAAVAAPPGSEKGASLAGWGDDQLPGGVQILDLALARSASSAALGSRSRGGWPPGAA